MCRPLIKTEDPNSLPIKANLRKDRLINLNNTAIPAHFNRSIVILSPSVDLAPRIPVQCWDMFPLAHASYFFQLSASSLSIEVPYEVMEDDSNLLIHTYFRPIKECVMSDRLRPSAFLVQTAPLHSILLVPPRLLISHLSEAFRASLIQRE